MKSSWCHHGNHLTAVTERGSPPETVTPPEDVFRLCLPLERRPPPHRLMTPDADTFEFASPSNDLRFLEAVVLRPEQVADYQPFGPVAYLALIEQVEPLL